MKNKKSKIKNVVMCVLDFAIHVEESVVMEDLHRHRVMRAGWNIGSLLFQCMLLFRCRKIQKTQKRKNEK